MLDLLWSPRLTRENFSVTSRWRTLTKLRAYRAGAQLHPGDLSLQQFRMVEHRLWLLRKDGTIVAQEFKNSLLDPIFRKIRERCGHEFISRDRGLVRLYKVLRRKGTTALLVDLTVTPSQGAVVIDCFGLKTSVTSAHAWLHERSGAPIIPAHCEPLPGGRYRVVFHPKIDNTAGMTHQQIAQVCWNSFEPYVRKNPAPWLWMYKHWRYRPANADRLYPFYANFLRPFEDILQRDRSGP